MKKNKMKRIRAEIGGIRVGCIKGEKISYLLEMTNQKLQSDKIIVKVNCDVTGCDKVKLNDVAQDDGVYLIINK